MNASPLVSVYIVSKDYGIYVEKAIESVLSQTYDNIELILISDGSTDSTIDVYSRYSLRAKHLIRNEDSRGLFYCANKALEICSGEFILRLDADDWLDVSAISALVCRALKEDKPSVVFGSYFYTDTYGAVIGFEFVQTTKGHSLSSLHPPHGACTLLRTRTVKAVRGYNIDFNAQDGWDIWSKIVGKKNIASIETPIFFYRQHTASLSVHSERLLQARSNILRTKAQSYAGSYSSNIVGLIPIDVTRNTQVSPLNNYQGKSLIEHSIDTAIDSTITHVIVNTNSPQLCEWVLERYANAAKPVIVHPRPKGLAEGRLALEDLMRYTISELNQSNIPVDALLYLNMHTPMRSNVTINSVIDILRVTESDTVITVEEERNPIFLYTSQGIKIVGKGRFDDLYHRSEVLLRYNGVCLATWAEAVKSGNLMDGSISEYFTSPSESEKLTLV